MGKCCVLSRESSREFRSWLEAGQLLATAAALAPQDPELQAWAGEPHPLDAGETTDAAGLLFAQLCAHDRACLTLTRGVRGFPRATTPLNIWATVTRSTAAERVSRHIALLIDALAEVEAAVYAEEGRPQRDLVNRLGDLEEHLTRQLENLHRPCTRDDLFRRAEPGSLVQLVQLHRYLRHTRPTQQMLGDVKASLRQLREDVRSVEADLNVRQFLLDHTSALLQAVQIEQEFGIPRLRTAGNAALGAVVASPQVALKIEQAGFGDRFREVFLRIAASLETHAAVNLAVATVAQAVEGERPNAQPGIQIVHVAVPVGVPSATAEVTPPPVIELAPGA
jgi:hypothetical protein